LTEKEREQLKSFETRRSSSVKRSTNVSTNAGTREKSFDRNSKENLYKSQEDINIHSERLSTQPAASIKIRASPLLQKVSSHPKFKKF